MLPISRQGWSANLQLLRGFDDFPGWMHTLLLAIIRTGTLPFGFLRTVRRVHLPGFEALMVPHSQTREEKGSLSFGGRAIPLSSPIVMPPCSFLSPLFKILGSSDPVFVPKLLPILIQLSGQFRHKAARRMIR